MDPALKHLCKAARHTHLFVERGLQEDALLLFEEVRRHDHFLGQVRLDDAFEGTQLFELRGFLALLSRSIQLLNFVNKCLTSLIESHQAGCLAPYLREAWLDESEAMAWRHLILQVDLLFANDIDFDFTSCELHDDRHGATLLRIICHDKQALGGGC